MIKRNDQNKHSPAAKITPDRNQDSLDDHLTNYQAKALAAGADEAWIVAASDIPVEDALAFKCRVPRCFAYGMCAHCPPHAPRPAEIRQLLTSYQRAIFFIRRVTPELLKRDRTDKERKAAYRSIFDIVGQIESAAFYDGHYLALGFGAGSCLSAFCDAKIGCQALEGKACRFPLRARPSMEAVGIDVYRLAANAGWEIYPFGQGAEAEDIPGATLAGIVLIQ